MKRLGLCFELCRQRGREFCLNEKEGSNFWLHKKRGSFVFMKKRGTTFVCIKKAPRFKSLRITVLVFCHVLGLVLKLVIFNKVAFKIYSFMVNVLVFNNELACLRSTKNISDFEFLTKVCVETNNTN